MPQRFLYFFLQAEDGIRAGHVTGVQTCALPIYWQRFEEAELVLAGLATPLVLSVHTIVSFDFATSVIPGWHTTIFPPYFVAGALFLGFAMVFILMVFTLIVLKLEEYINIAHMELIKQVILMNRNMVG